MNEAKKFKSQLLDEIRHLRSELTRINQNEERFALALQGSTDGWWDWDLATNKTNDSSSWKRMLGFGNIERENILDIWAHLTHENDKSMVLEAAEDDLTSRTNSFEVEMRMQHKADHEIFISSHAFLVKRESDGQPIRLIGTDTDITALKKKKNGERNAKILKMIALGESAPEVYDAIALMYEKRHPGMRCSMLERHKNILRHGGHRVFQKNIAMR
jgi:PAS domain S-box-containing protein